MNRVDFLNELYYYLSPLSNKEKNEIIEDFREHFREGAADGKTEEQICNELGSPLECARQYCDVNIAPEKPKNTPKKKAFWTVVLIWNIIQGILGIPLTIGFFVASIVMAIAFALIGSYISSVAFVVFAVSSTVAVFVLSILMLLLAIDGIRDAIKMINR